MSCLVDSAKLKVDSAVTAQYMYLHRYVDTTSTFPSKFLLALLPTPFILFEIVFAAARHSAPVLSKPSRLPSSTQSQLDFAIFAETATLERTHLTQFPGIVTTEEEDTLQSYCCVLHISGHKTCMAHCDPTRLIRSLPLT